MGTNREQETADSPRAESVTTDESGRLDRAMLQADDRLIASLQRDEQRRRHRRRWWIGGTLMILAILTVTVGLMTAAPGSRPAESADAKLARAASLNTRGWDLWKQQKFSEAEDVFSKAVRLDPESTNAWNGLGWSRFNQGKGTEAEEPFTTCIKLDPKYAAALNGLGQVYLSLRDYKKAEEPLVKAAELGASAAWYGLTRLYLLQGKFDKAAGWAEKVVTQQPNDETAKKMLAAAKAGKLDADLRKAIEPPDPKAQSAEAKRGWMFFNRGDMKRAAAEFEKAVKANPNEANAQNGLGFCLVSQGDAAEARKHFEICLKLEPKHVGAMNGMARCLKAEGKTDEAIAMWEKMLQIAPGPNAGTYGLADTYFEQKDYSKAAKYYEELAKADPKDETVKQRLEEARKGAAEKK
jgi:tetratricopeptide (TPR) repeat protein